MPMYEAPKLDVGGGGQFLDLETAVKDGILGGGGGGGIKAVAGETLDLKKMIEELSSVEVPSVFICPISLEPMQDPVTLCTGQTYERANILKWLSMGHAITFAITVGHRHFYSSPPPFNRLQQFGKVGGRSWCSRDHSFQPWSSPTGLCTCYNHGFGGVKLTTTT